MTYCKLADPDGEEECKSGTIDPPYDVTNARSTEEYDAVAAWATLHDGNSHVSCGACFPFGGCKDLHRNR